MPSPASALDEKGVAVGRSIASGSKVLIDRFSRRHPHSVGFGERKSGRTVTAKTMLLRAARKRGDIRLVMIEPYGEYGSVREALGGQQAVIGGGTAVNPLEIRPSDASSEDALVNRIENVVGFFELQFSREACDLDGLRADILETAVRKAYIDAGIGSDPATHSRTPPTLSDVAQVVNEIAASPRVFTRETNGDYADWIASAASDLLVRMLPLADGDASEDFNRHTEFDIGESRATHVVVRPAGATLGQRMHATIDAICEQAKTVSEEVFLVVDSAHHLFESEPAVKRLARTLRRAGDRRVGAHLVLTAPSTVFDPLDGEVADAIPIRHYHCLPTTRVRLSSLPDTIDVADRDFLNDASNGSDGGGSEAVVSTSDATARVRLRPSDQVLSIASHEGDSPYPFTCREFAARHTE